MIPPVTIKHTHFQNILFWYFHVWEKCVIKWANVEFLLQDMAAVSAGCVSVTLTTREAPATALWTPPPAWPPTSRSVTAEGSVSAGPAGAPTPSSRGPPVRSAPPAPESVLSTSQWKTCTHLWTHCVTLTRLIPPVTIVTVKKFFIYKALKTLLTDVLVHFLQIWKK